MMNMMIICSGLDQVLQTIREIHVQHQNDKLSIEAHTKTQIYQGQLYQDKTEIPLDQMKKYLQNVECRQVSQNQGILKFVSYDVHFVLISQKMLTLQKLQSKQTELKHYIQQIKTELILKLKELSLLEQKIQQISSQFKQKSQTFQPYIKIDSIYQVSNFSEKQQIDFVSKDQQFPNIREFWLNDNKITDLGVKMLAQNGHKFPYLKELWLSNNLITDMGLISLVKNSDKLPRLEAIWLKNNQITDSSLQVLAENGDKFIFLQKLGLGINKISDTGLKKFAQNGLRFPYLRDIWLNSNLITDEGLKSLVQNGNKFLNLQMIGLDENKITDVGLKSLIENGNKFPSLHTVWLNKNVITETEKNNFLETLNVSFQIYT